ncbi:hypothetical protein [Spirosoma montaniterrae]|uniref:Uncharacterized protein n=1 Tax=Spirosoma montaniterrae TaxID=1178516 RepID=A0A1P9WSQ2_9BACT|nr:hypothetical protein [Spirosoma montaniterrae]AQG78380.1 hypothetical protein AWR27_02935 [Spirosoma montaniterrae]
MNTFTKHVATALLGVAFLSSCSRPVAYFQRGPVENYHTPKTETVAVVTPAEAPQPVVVEAPTVDVTPAPAVVAATPASQVEQAQTALKKLDAYVRNDSKLASNKKLAQRMERVNTALAATSAKAAVTTPTAAPQKMTFAQKLMVKKMNKDIKDKMMGKKAMAKSVLVIGAVVAIIGLILILLGVGGLGVIALIVGLVLMLLDLLDVV